MNNVSTRFQMQKKFKNIVSKLAFWIDFQLKLLIFWHTLGAFSFLSFFWKYMKFRNILIQNLFQWNSTFYFIFCKYKKVLNRNSYTYFHHKMASWMYQKFPRCYLLSAFLSSTFDKRKLVRCGHHKTFFCIMEL